LAPLTPVESDQSACQHCQRYPQRNFTPGYGHEHLETFPLKDRICNTFFRREESLLLGGPVMPAKSHPKKRQATPKRWVASVDTDSTHPPEGLFTKSAETIARTLASKKVSPKGPASGMRMLTYFLNRGGHGLSQERRAELEKAKGILSGYIEKEKSSAARTSRKTTT
jgi:tRNA(adenine34) deaminase